MDKAKHGSNASTNEKVVNFVRFIDMISPKAAQAVSANIDGISKRYLKSLNARNCKEAIIDSGEDNQNVHVRMKEAILRRKSDSSNKVAFPIAVDATKVAKILEVSQPMKGIVDGAYPQHIVDISGKSKEEVKAMLNGTKINNKESDDPPLIIELADEIKVAVMTFQDSPSGVAPTEVVAARPQSNNESNDFIKFMESAALAAANAAEVSPMSFKNIACDGVSCESK